MRIPLVKRLFRSGGLSLCTCILQKPLSRPAFTREKPEDRLIHETNASGKAMPELENRGHMSDVLVVRGARGGDANHQNFRLTMIIYDLAREAVEGSHY